MIAYNLFYSLYHGGEGGRESVLFAHLTKGAFYGLVMGS